jgi:sodium transport system permease protein
MKASNGLLVVLKKEFTRFFTDKRQVLGTLLAPGLMIFVMYALMWQGMFTVMAGSSDEPPTIYAVNLPQSIEAPASEAGLEFTQASASNVDGIKQEIVDQAVDVLVVFPADFDTQVAAGMDRSGTAPAVEVYYNSAKTESSEAYNAVRSMLSSYQDSLYKPFTVNAGDGAFDLASSADILSMVMGGIMPMMILMFLFIGCMAIAAESLAGEKERGTMATMLVTPLKRWQLAAGKIISVSVISLLAGISVVVGMIGAMVVVFIMQGDMFASAGESIAASGVLPADLPATILPLASLAWLVLVILATVLLFVGIISLFSAWAKTVKEASSYAGVLMFAVIAIGVAGMFFPDTASELVFYLVPVYNSALAIMGIFTFDPNPLFIAVSIVANLVYTGACIFILTRMFNSEKVMFKR